MEREVRYGMNIARMDSIINFLVYVSRTYRDTNPYFKGVYLTLVSWIPYMDEEGWMMIREYFKMADVEGK